LEAVHGRLPIFLNPLKKTSTLADAGSVVDFYCSLRRLDRKSRSHRPIDR
jgi:hypothetical protein